MRVNVNFNWVLRIFSTYITQATHPSNKPTQPKRVIKKTQALEWKGHLPQQSSLRIRHFGGEKVGKLRNFQHQKKNNNFSILFLVHHASWFPEVVGKFVYHVFFVFDFYESTQKTGYEELHSQPKLRYSRGSLQLMGIQVLMAKWTTSPSTKVLCHSDLWWKKKDTNTSDVEQVGREVVSC